MEIPFVDYTVDQIINFEEDKVSMGEAFFDMATDEFQMNELRASMSMQNLREEFKPSARPKQIGRSSSLSKLHTLKKKQHAKAEVNRWKNKRTIVQPFSFAKRDEELLQKKKELRQKAETEKRRGRKGSLDSLNKNPVGANRPKRTIPQPFSFEARDMHMLKKKEEFIKNAQEELSARAKFQAKPVPTYFKRQRSAESLRSTKSAGSSGTHIEFKEFTSALSRRALERKKFDEYLKEKERQNEERLRVEREKAEKLEREEIARLRKLCEPKANPLKPLKEFKIVRSYKQPTLPVTPQVLKHRKACNKENQAN